MFHFHSTTIIVCRLLSFCYLCLIMVACCLTCCHHLLQIWFQNRRAKHRRKEKKRSAEEQQSQALQPPSFWPSNLPFDSNIATKPKGEAEVLIALHIYLHIVLNCSLISCIVSHSWLYEFDCVHHCRHSLHLSGSDSVSMHNPLDVGCFRLQ